MKWITALSALVLSGLLAACGKEHSSSGRELLGTWVDINHTADTLVFYNEGGKVYLYDNSMTTRAVLAAGRGDKQARFEIKLVDNKLMTKNVGGDISGLDSWTHGRFEWIVQNREFSVEPNGFRAFLSYVGCPQQFRRVE